MAFFKDFFSSKISTKKTDLSKNFVKSLKHTLNIPVNKFNFVKLEAEI